MILRRRYKTEKQQQQQLKSDLKSSHIADWGLWIGDSENKNNVGLGSSNGLRTPLCSSELLCTPLDHRHYYHLVLVWTILLPSIRPTTIVHSCLFQLLPLVKALVIVVVVALI